MRDDRTERQDAEAQEQRTTRHLIHTAPEIEKILYRAGYVEPRLADDDVFTSGLLGDVA
jgi:hypothetical protein